MMKTLQNVKTVKMANIEKEFKNFKKILTVQQIIIKWFLKNPKISKPAKNVNIVKIVKKAFKKHLS